jgi:hypothetical protein
MAIGFRDKPVDGMGYPIFKQILMDVMIFLEGVDTHDS